MSNDNSSYSPNNWPTTGTQVSAPMIPPGGGNTGGLTHYAKYGHGGYRSVATLDDRDALSLKCLELGMMVNIVADDKDNNNGLWILDSIDESDNRNWKKLSIDDYENLNINAFQNIGWNSENFPTNATYGAWPSTISAKGWFLGKVEEIIGSKTDNQKFSDYKIWLTDKQQHSNNVYSWTDKTKYPFINEDLLVDPEGIEINHILSVYTGQSYINNCLVTNIDKTDKSITVKIVNTDTNPFSSTFGYSPYFKGVVLITGEASDTTTAANYKGKLDTKNYNPFDFITNNYISNGIVELGYNNLSSGDSNTLAGFMGAALGPDHTIYDGYSMSFGKANTVFGYSSGAIGQSNKVFGEKSIAVGAVNQIAASFSFASGHNNKLFGYNRFVNGKGYSYSGITVGGCSNTVDLRDQSTPVDYPANTVFGYGLQSKTPGQTLFGKFNKVNDSIFAIGNGASSAAANRSNAFEVTMSGLTKANNGLEITKGNLQITDGYLNMKVFKYNDDGSTSPTEKYASVKLIAYDDDKTEIVEDDLVLNIVDVQTIATLAGNATVNDSIKMNVYRNNGESTNQTASLQCVQLGEGNDAQYSLRIFR